MNNENINKKSKIVAILLYIFLGPFSLGDLYLGYKKEFRNQMLRLAFIIVMILFKTSDLGIVSIVLSLAFMITSIWIFVVYISNLIKGFKIIFGKIQTDANGIKLE